MSDGNKKTELRNSLGPREADGNFDQPRKHDHPLECGREVKSSEVVFIIDRKKTQRCKAQGDDVGLGILESPENQVSDERPNNFEVIGHFSSHSFADIENRLLHGRNIDVVTVAEKGMRLIVGSTKLVEMLLGIG
jgi:hypothetical protein